MYNHTEKIAAALALVKKNNDIIRDTAEQNQCNQQSSPIQNKRRLDHGNGRPSLGVGPSRPVDSKILSSKPPPNIRRQIVPSVNNVTAKTMTSHWNTSKQHERHRPLKAVNLTHNDCRPISAKSVNSKSKDKSVAASRDDILEKENVRPIHEMDPSPDATLQWTAEYKDTELVEEDITICDLDCTTQPPVRQRVLTDTWKTLASALKLRTTNDKSSCKTENSLTKSSSSTSNDVLLKSSGAGDDTSTSNIVHSSSDEPMPQSTTCPVKRQRCNVRSYNTDPDQENLQKHQRTSLAVSKRRGEQDHSTRRSTFSTNKLPGGISASLQLELNDVVDDMEIIDVVEHCHRTKRAQYPVKLATMSTERKHDVHGNQTPMRASSIAKGGAYRQQNAVYPGSETQSECYKGQLKHSNLSGKENHLPMKRHQMNKNAITLNQSCNNGRGHGDGLTTGNFVERKNRHIVHNYRAGESSTTAHFERHQTSRASDSTMTHTNGKNSTRQINVYSTTSQQPARTTGARSGTTQRHPIERKVLQTSNNDHHVRGCSAAVSTTAGTTNQQSKPRSSGINQSSKPSGLQEMKHQHGHHQTGLKVQPTSSASSSSTENTKKRPASRESGSSNSESTPSKRQSRGAGVSSNAAGTQSNPAEEKRQRESERKLRKFYDLPRNKRVLEGLKLLDKDDIKAVRLQGRSVKLGEGSYGKVYLRDFNGKLVVEKQMIRRPKDTEVTRAYYFFKELEAMRVVSHLPQFPTLIGYTDEFPYESIVMEYLADPCSPAPVTLHQVLKCPDLANSQIIKICSDITEGLQHLHNSGYLHCDLKTNNLLVRRIYRNGRVTRAIEGKIIDLGCAHKLTDPSIPRKFDTDLFDANTLKYPYIAPEILLNLTGYTVASDVFSLGYVICLAGRMYHLNALQSLGRKCMDKTPDNRPTIAHVKNCLLNLRS